MVSRAWIDDFNDIIRDVIFADDELRSLMLLPEDIDILTFIDSYFIEGEGGSTVLVDEPVRIVYGTFAIGNAGNPYVTRNILSFDIYVRKEDAHNVENDRLVKRTQLITARLINLLTAKRYHGVYRFWVEGEGTKFTSTIGYSRYNVNFGFEKVYG